MHASTQRATPSEADTTQAAIEAMTQTIVERWNPERIILFGSRARGQARLDSDEATHDLDVLVRALPDDGTWTTRSKYKSLSVLSLHATESRYLANDAPVTHQDAERAARLAGGIVASIHQDLDNHGFTVLS